MVDLRAKAAKVLSRDIPDGVWELMGEEEVLRDYEYLQDIPEKEWEKSHHQHFREMLDVVRRFMKPYTGSPVERGRNESRRQTKQADVDVELSDSETAYARAYGSLYSVLADNEPDVRWFRRVLLGGCELTNDEARSFFDSDACRLLSLKRFVELQIPFVHDAQVLTPDWKYPPLEPIELRISPPGNVVRIEPVPLPDWTDEYQGSSDGLPGSVRHELLKSARLLARRYNWQEREAVDFILTYRPPGVVPVVAAAEWVFAPDDSVWETNHVFRCQHWVSAETVASYQKAYQRRQEQAERAGHGDQDTRRGSRNHLVGKRNLALFSFVIGMFREPGRKPSWSRMLEMWNERADDTRQDWDPGSSKDWRYANVWLMHRDWTKTKERLVKCDDPWFPLLEKISLEC